MYRRFGAGSAREARSGWSWPCMSAAGPRSNRLPIEHRAWRSIRRRRRGFRSPPIVCANGKDVCAISTLFYEPQQQYRLERSSGEYVAENKLLPPWTRFIDTTGLVDLGDRPGNTLGLLRNGAVHWLTKVSAAFPSGYSSD